MVVVVEDRVNGRCGEVAVSGGPFDNSSFNTTKTRYLDVRGSVNSHLLYVTKHIGSDCEQSFTFFTVQRRNKISGVIFAAFLVSV